MGALLTPETVLADEDQPELIRWDLVAVGGGALGRGEFRRFLDETSVSATGSRSTECPTTIANVAVVTRLNAGEIRRVLYDFFGFREPF